MFGRTFVQFISLLIEENSNAQVALSIVMGMFLGFFPTFSLQWLLCLLLCLLFRFNILSVAGSCLFFQFIQNLIEPYLDNAGLIILTSLPSLFPVWRWMYHAPIFPYSAFNSTIDIAASLLAFALSPIVFIIFYFICRMNRDRILNLWRSTRLFRTYASYRYIQK